jgi:S-adenosyl methyltransferase
MLAPGVCKPLPLQQSGDNRTPGLPLAQYASVAHVARVYDYLLGGKDNFAALSWPYAALTCGNTR